MNARRLQRIEQMYLAIHPPAVKCPCCGDIDPLTRSGPFLGGVVIDLGDLAWHWCKHCGREFNARDSVDDQGRHIVTDVQPASGGPF